MYVIFVVTANNVKGDDGHDIVEKWLIGFLQSTGIDFFIIQVVKVFINLAIIQTLQSETKKKFLCIPRRHLPMMVSPIIADYQKRFGILHRLYEKNANGSPFDDENKHNIDDGLPQDEHRDKMKAMNIAKAAELRAQFMNPINNNNTLMENSYRNDTISNQTQENLLIDNSVLNHIDSSKGLPSKSNTLPTLQETVQSFKPGSASPQLRPREASTASTNSLGVPQLQSNSPDNKTRQRSRTRKRLNFNPEGQNSSNTITTEMNEVSLPEIDPPLQVQPRNRGKIGKISSTKGYSGF